MIARLESSNLPPDLLTTTIDLDLLGPSLTFNSV